jgi:hypothetical protein
LWGTDRGISSRTGQTMRMASLRVHPDRLEIHLTPAEKTLAFRRENLVIARDTIRSVTITDDPWIWMRGIRAPGALVPLVLAIGTWKFHGGKDFLAIKRKRQAVVIDLIGDDFARLILSTNHAPDLIASLKLEGTAADDAPEQAEPVATADAPGAVPAKPVKRARTPKPATPAKPVALADPADPSKPVKPATPARRPRPAKPAEPAEPAEPTVVPEVPDAPAAPDSTD